MGEGRAVRGDERPALNAPFGFGAKLKRFSQSRARVMRHALHRLSGEAHYASAFIAVAYATSVKRCVNEAL
jgi:hypothetical protein